MVEIAPSLTEGKLLIPGWTRALRCSPVRSMLYLPIEKTINCAIAKEVFEKHLDLEWARISEIFTGGETIR